MFAWFAVAMATDALGLASINPIAASSLIGFGTPPPDVDINFSIVDFHGIEDDTIPYNESTSSGNLKKIPIHIQKHHSFCCCIYFYKYLFSYLMQFYI